MDEKIIEGGLHELRKGFWEKLFALERIPDAQRGNLLNNYLEAWKQIQELEELTEMTKKNILAKAI